MNFLEVTPIPVAEHLSNAKVNGNAEGVVPACVCDAVKTRGAYLVRRQATAFDQLETLQGVFVVEMGVDVFSQGTAERQTEEASVFTETPGFGILTSLDPIGEITIRGGF